jgi:hypothetical protein
VTVTGAIARRDALALRRKLVSAVADAAGGGGERRLWRRQLRSELRDLTDLPVGELRRQADDLAGRYRELDIQLQQAN